MRTNFLWVFTNFTFYHSSSNTVAIWFEVRPISPIGNFKFLSVLVVGETSLFWRNFVVQIIK